MTQQSPAEQTYVRDGAEAWAAYRQQRGAAKLGTKKEQRAHAVYAARYAAILDTFRAATDIHG
mgnify:CR=1 FL=1